MEKPATVDDYIAGFPRPMQRLLNQLRATIRRAAPEAEERISYAMPAYALHGPLVYFAGFAHHVGFYATPTGHQAFARKLAGYKQGKGSVQFPLDEPLPLELVAEMVAWRVKENEARAAGKGKG